MHSDGTHKLHYRNLLQGHVIPNSQYCSCSVRVSHRKVQTLQAWSRCDRGQYEGEVSKQEFQGLNLTSDKTDKFALVKRQLVQFWILCTKDVYTLGKVFLM